MVQVLVVCPKQEGMINRFYLLACILEYLFVQVTAKTIVPALCQRISWYLCFFSFIVYVDVYQPQYSTRLVE